MNTNKRAKLIAQLSVFIAVMIVIEVISQTVFSVFALPIRPTITHIPVIIASIIYGPKIGAYLGGFMGIMSVVRNTIILTQGSYLFSPFVANGSYKSLIIAIVPRLLIGVLPYYIYKWLSNKAGLAIAGVIGSLANTLFVLSGMFLFFNQIYEGNFQKFLGAVFTTNSLIEMIIAGIITAIAIPRLEKLSDN